MKIKLARWLRKHADRLDYDGAPKRTSWSMTFEDGVGTVFNQDGRGCPLWYYGSDDYRRAHIAERWVPDDCEIEWVAVGTRTPSGVSVLGTAEVHQAAFTRRINGYDEIGVPGSRSSAKVPRWRITLTCSMDSWVNVPGLTFRDAVEGMFRQDGRTS